MKGTRRQKPWQERLGPLLAAHVERVGRGEVLAADIRHDDDCPQADDWAAKCRCDADIRIVSVDHP